MPKLTYPTLNGFGKLLRQYSSSPSSACQNLSNFNHPITEVAVLGGGITGLASAYYLSTSLPKTKITLFEESSRLGGWLHSKTVDVGNGNIIFEQGPRSLRPDTTSALVTLDLVGLKWLNLSLNRADTNRYLSLISRTKFFGRPRTQSRLKIGLFITLII